MRYLFHTRNHSFGCYFSLLILALMAFKSAAHDGLHHNQAWQACETKSLGDTCDYVMQTNQLYKGTCRAISDALMCVRHHPIETLSTDQLSKYYNQPMALDELPIESHTHLHGVKK